MPSLATSGEREVQEGERRWIPSLAVTSGVTLQRQSGAQQSFRYEDSDPSRQSVLR